MGDVLNFSSSLDSSHWLPGSRNGIEQLVEHWSRAHHIRQVVVLTCTMEVSCYAKTLY